MQNPLTELLISVRAAMYIYGVCFLIFPTILTAQNLPEERSAEWAKAGLQDTFKPCFILSILDFGADTTGDSPTNSNLNAAINMLDGEAGIIFFPHGEYFFNAQINLPSNCVLRGSGAGETTLIFDLGGGGNCISAIGNYGGEPDSLSSSVSKKDTLLIVENPQNFEVGDYILLFMDDAHLLNDTWAANQVSHLTRIVDISSDSLFIDQKIRLDYPLNYFSRIRKIIPKSFVGVENLKIIRQDQSAGQTKNIFFRRAVNCWVKGVESDHCNFGHVVFSQMAYSEVSGCHFHHAFNYGTGGKAYGVVLEAGSNLNRVDNNVFNHLRHSILLQSGANGNVVAYNYSTDPFWSHTPTDAGGDLVLHGNYPFANLFESNVVANIRIDASHGINGPYNTFLRNRAELYGLIMSNTPPSDSQNIIGSEITLSGGFYGNFILAGNDHFNYGNNVLSNTTPNGTENIDAISFGYEIAPSFLEYPAQWPYVGYPLTLNQKTIPADNRYNLESAPFTVNAPLYSIQCDSNIWTGCALNFNWHDASNWSRMQLPDINMNVKIDFPIKQFGFLPTIYQDTALAKSIEIISNTQLEINQAGFLFLKDQ